MINETAELARQKDIKGILEHVSKDYKDPEGNDRNALKGLVAVADAGEGKLLASINEQLATPAPEAQAAQ